MVMLARIKLQRQEAYAHLKAYVRKAVKGGESLFLPSLNFPFLLGLVDYHPKTDAMEYVGPNRVSKFYADQPEAFPPIDFFDRLSVVLAEIRLPENRNRDTHDLGKSTLGRSLDLGFLAGRDPKFLLFKYPQRFDGYTY